VALVVIAAITVLAILVYKDSTVSSAEASETLLENKSVAATDSADTAFDGISVSDYVATDAASDLPNDTAYDRPSVLGLSYTDYPTVPDFAAATGLTLIAHTDGTFVYSLPQADEQDIYIGEYENTLINAGFTDVSESYGSSEQIGEVLLSDNDYIIYRDDGVYVFAYAYNDDIAETVAKPRIYVQISLDSTPGPVPLTPVEIAEKCTPAVFEIAVYDKREKLICTGSGVFLQPDGTAITNLHVIGPQFVDSNVSAVFAYAITSDGTRYEIQGWYDYDELNDLALIKVRGGGFPYLTVGDDALLEQGESVYAIGSPLGLDNTFSEGVVSHINRMIDNYKIQFTASVSNGNSGGALVNGKGELVGIPTLAARTDYAETVQNLNFATPIKFLKGLSKGDYYELPVGSKQKICTGTKEVASVIVPSLGEMSASVKSSGTAASAPVTTAAPVAAASAVTAAPKVTEKTTQTKAVTYYAAFPEIPDFGAYFGFSCSDKFEKADIGMYTYFDADAEDYISKYCNLLKAQGFKVSYNSKLEAYKTETAKGKYIYVTKDKSGGISISIVAE